MTSGARVTRRLGLYLDSFLELWLGYGLVIWALFGASVVTLIWLSGNPLWWIVAIVYGLCVAIGFLAPWWDSQ